MSNTIWPNNAPFALFLSHDIDQIYDRELFHFLATLNHLRRMLMFGERGSYTLALRRLCRIIFAPKPAEKDFRTILEIEGEYGFKSTFFVLHDECWRRNGARYPLNSEALARIVGMIREAGGEIGLHGGFYRFNDADKYLESRELLEQQFGIEVSGIRNHLLRFSNPETWLAQEAAGFSYDASFGYPDRPGARDDEFFPFHPENPENGEAMALTVLPLTVMDATLFRNMNLDYETAMETAWNAIESVIEQGGLVSLLWHNNFFNEPEYGDWQTAYQELLARLAKQKPWCATGKEIVEYWG